METVNIREVNVQYGKASEYSSFTTPNAVVNFLRSVAPNNSQEHLIALYLDGKHAPIGYSVVCTGLANSCVLHPREVFQRAVLLGACAVIMAHNHPSGSAQRSSADDKATKDIAAAGRVLGIRLLDHVIFTDSDYYSYEGTGKLEEVCR